MPRTTREREVAETFDQQYELVLADVILAMERESYGSDYGGTTQDDPDLIALFRHQNAHTVWKNLNILS